MFARWLIFLAAALVIGCSSSLSTSHLPRGGPNTLTLIVVDQLSWPYELTFLQVTLDGQPLLARSEPESDPMVVGPIPLVPGDHQVHISASAEFASGEAGSSCRIRMRQRMVFRTVRQKAASMLIEPHAGSVTESFAERFSIAMRVEGAEELPAESAPSSYSPETRVEPVCRQAEPVARAICVAEARVQEARAQRDLIALTCYDEKLQRMRVLQRMIEHSERARIADVPQGVAEHEAAKVQTARERVALLWNELEQCLCDYPVEVATFPIREVSGRGCEGYGTLNPTFGDRPLDPPPLPPR